jgi:APA family basic amino acid/polyamine antiporter
VSFAPSAAAFSQVISAPFAISLVFVMYSFSGWNAATYIIGEMRMPERNLPRAMLVGTLVVLVLYVALNAVFLHTAPIDKLAGQLDVARVSGSFIFGETGGRIVGAMICVGLISSISAMMWIGPRVMMTMGEDVPALRVFAKRSHSGAPVYAILFQLTVASLMLLTRSFEAVLDFIQFSLLFCSFFVVLGVIKLRITHPDLPRPYRAWGYPVTPVVFLLVTGFMMYYLLTGRPLQSALGTLIMISGLLIYAIFRKRADGHAIVTPGRE